jgi:hypothetical protein
MEEKEDEKRGDGTSGEIMWRCIYFDSDQTIGVIKSSWLISNNQCKYPKNNPTRYILSQTADQSLEKFITYDKIDISKCSGHNNLNDACKHERTLAKELQQKMKTENLGENVNLNSLIRRIVTAEQTVFKTGPPKRGSKVKILQNVDLQTTNNKMQKLNETIEVEDETQKSIENLFDSDHEPSIIDNTMIMNKLDVLQTELIEMKNYLFGSRQAAAPSSPAFSSQASSPSFSPSSPIIPINKIKTFKLSTNQEFVNKLTHNVEYCNEVIEAVYSNISRSFLKGSNLKATKIIGQIIRNLFTSNVQDVLGRWKRSQREAK